MWQMSVLLANMFVAEHCSAVVALALTIAYLLFALICKILDK